jgi:hypothetical protein
MQYDETTPNYVRYVVNILQETKQQKQEEFQELMKEQNSLR